VQEIFFRGLHCLEGDKKNYMTEPIQIFLVDANESELAATRSALQIYKVHHTLHYARSGKEAFVLLHRHKSIAEKSFILLISPQLPDMKGTDLVGEIRRQRSWKQPRCFIMVDQDYGSNPFQYKHLELSGFVAKPLKLNSPSGIGELNLAIDLMNYRMLHGI
jgi:response regulator RpfG family c-di-GMP phosphodiesterase